MVGSNNGFLRRRWTTASSRGKYISGKLSWQIYSLYNGFAISFRLLKAAVVMFNSSGYSIMFLFIKEYYSTKNKQKQLQLCWYSLGILSSNLDIIRFSSCKNVFNLFVIPTNASLSIEMSLQDLSHNLPILMIISLYFVSFPIPPPFDSALPRYCHICNIYSFTLLYVGFTFIWKSDDILTSFSTFYILWSYNFQEWKL